MSTDGEDIVISNGYDPGLQQQFDDANIDYGRVGASTTSIHNSCDRAHSFRDTKSEGAKARRKDINVRNEVLRSSVHAAFDKFKTAYPSINVTAAFKENIIEGLEVLVYAWKKSCSATEIKRSFHCCGQHCEPIESKDNITIDFKVMMAQCYTKCTMAQMENMEAQTDRCASIVEETGTLTWGQMNDANIPKHENSVDRTNLTHIRHWSEIINHTKTVERFLAEKAAKDPVVLLRQQQDRDAAVAREKEVVAARKLIEKSTKAQLKKDEAQRIKAAELARFTALSPEQQKDEKNRLKLEKSIKLSEKKAAETLKLQQAQAVVAAAQVEVPGIAIDHMDDMDLDDNDFFGDEDDEED